jgi:hypothetical protein
VDLSSLQTQRTLREGLEFCRRAIARDRAGVS